ncbi:uncharacterized protein LOC108865240 [Galendromus occidentalis]|uniref:Uncharacterized protein LOC108865240 n=1 Tax=Galendromus occidentalis TaxID=34638 RepID=A0AAJ7PB20_9ACAR|nr:uncharacterized protein LOC108865240 [Galendromus occidentalis]
MSFCGTRKNTISPAPIRLHERECGIDDCHCPALEFVDRYKYLGLIVQADLKSTGHVEKIVSRARSGVAILARLRGCCSMKLKKAVYHALIESHVNFMLSIYGGTHNQLIAKIERLQRKDLRFICNSSWDASCAPLYERTKISTIQELYVKSLVRLMYSRMPTLERPSHEYPTRFSEERCLSIPKLRKDFSRRSALWNFIRLYNKLPTNLRKLFESQTNVDRKKCQKQIKELGITLK